jgi:hypothetical protein
MSNNPNFYITHIIVPELPENGFDQVFFYTATAESYDKGKYFWGTDNNSFDQEFIDNLITQGKIFILDTEQYPLPLKEDETLWVDSAGEIYKADLHDPTKNQEKLRRQSYLKNLIVNEVYSRSVEPLKKQNVWPPNIERRTVIENQVPQIN